MLKFSVYHATFHKASSLLAFSTVHFTTILIDGLLLFICSEKVLKSSDKSNPDEIFRACISKLFNLRLMDLKASREHVSVVWKICNILFLLERHLFCNVIHESMDTCMSLLAKYSHKPKKSLPTSQKYGDLQFGPVNWIHFWCGMK